VRFLKKPDVKDQTLKRAYRKVGVKNMLFGALWCFGGIVVTAMTYQAASNGGHYIIAWGAVLFGAIQFLRGLFQVLANVF
jgi:hypothetical protein